MGSGGADWLERPGRDEEQRPDEIIRTMGLKKGDTVADLGAGTGYFTRRLARAVAPSGIVYAVDIQPEMMTCSRRTWRKRGSGTWCPFSRTRRPEAAEGLSRLGAARGRLPRAPAAESHARESPRGLEADGPGRPRGVPTEGLTALHVREEHRMSTKQVLSEWEPAGFRLVKLPRVSARAALFRVRKDAGSLTGARGAGGGLRSACATTAGSRPARAGSSRTFCSELRT